MVIEPENQPRYVWYSEVPKLLRDDAPLKVLITYHAYKKETPEEWRQEFLRQLENEVAGGSHPVRPSGEVEVLCILGDKMLEDPSDWHGFCLRREDGAWVTTPLKKPQL